MRFMSAFIALLAMLAAAGPASSAEQDETRRQQVLISFDGAHDTAQWARALALGEKTGARFTFFLSCTFLLSPDTKGSYVAPVHGRAASNVGFGKSREDVRQRLIFILKAHQAGHEIASHGCGHFDGKDWTAADWDSEFASFARILANAWTINGFGPAPDGWAQMAVAVKGFRAPYLSTNEALFAVLAKQGFSYDASTVAKVPVKAKRKGGIHLLPLPMIPEGPAAKPVIAMDYNWFVRHSAGMDNPSKADEYEARAYAALMAQFERERSGAGRPVQAGFHFTLMNDGAYWRALERFAGDVCLRADTDCVPMIRHVRGAGPALAAKADGDS